MDEHPLIAFRDGAAGRRPALVGTRLDVAQVVETIRQNGNSIADAGRYLDVPTAHVEACARYYADFPEEIDAWIAEGVRVADAAEASWHRRSELFA